MAKYRKRPIIVDAEPEPFHPYSSVQPAGVFLEHVGGTPNSISGQLIRFYVITIHGQRAYLEDGDRIISEPDGIHHYPCKPDIFESTYEAVT